MANQLAHNSEVLETQDEHEVSDRPTLKRSKKYTPNDLNADLSPLDSKHSSGLMNFTNYRHYRNVSNPTRSDAVSNEELTSQRDQRHTSSQYSDLRSCGSPCSSAERNMRTTPNLPSQKSSVSRIIENREGTLSLKLGKTSKDKHNYSRSKTQQKESKQRVRKRDVHPKEQNNVRFDDLAIGKDVSAEELIGVMLRDDYFLNMMADEPLKDIHKIWREIVGDMEAQGK